MKHSVERTQGDTLRTEPGLRGAGAGKVQRDAGAGADMNDEDRIKCPKCEGEGVLAYDISPAEDGAVPCDLCDGTGFKAEPLIVILI